ncbi:MAG TPA: alkaline phosphatase family protein, partial [Thermoanaerobaculia bacterium]|nr:alkaline phosphatase family protein [Thermoanaerobaculia bacterium]
YGVAIDNDHVYVSCWGDSTVKIYRRDETGLLSEARRITVSRHPSALLLAGSRLYVTSASSNQIDIVDVSGEPRVIATLVDSAPAGPTEGSTPNAVLLSSDGKRLFVAEADNNAVAVFDLQTNQLLGRIPTDWYPSALARVGTTIFVACAKGHGTAPNPEFPQPTRRRSPTSHDYTLGQLDGSLVSFPEDIADFAALSKRVADANGWTSARSASQYPPFKHVIYIIKENRTYDQVLGDIREGDGDRSLVYFGPNSSPNHHELARRFGLFDRFFTNAEVSAEGHNWSTAAYSGDYTEKTVPSNYSGRGRTYDYEGENRGVRAFGRDDVNSPSTGYIWDAAVRKKIFLRNYGEFVASGKLISMPETQYYPAKRALIAASSKEYPGFDLDITDQTRVDIWKKEFDHYVASNNMPQLEIIRLPNDHTAAASANKPTPRAYMADNDLALGRIVEAVSHSPYWHDTVIFVVEDDAQNGPDHVDSHRSLLFVISPYNLRGTIHRFTNTTDVLATIEEILGLDALSQFDFYGRPLRGIFAATPDLTPYDVLKPTVNMNEKNPPSPLAHESAKLDLDDADAADENAFNRILWRAIKGDKVPYPGTKRAPTPVGQ